jgi:hypothetical protein
MWNLSPTGLQWPPVSQWETANHSRDSVESSSSTITSGEPTRTASITLEEVQEAGEDLWFHLHRVHTLRVLLF